MKFLLIGESLELKEEPKDVFLGLNRVSSLMAACERNRNILWLAATMVKLDNNWGFS